ncbi:MAG: hypothetical protein Kow0098_26250 [Ignavibacteriaceae bacterium]
MEINLNLIELHVFRIVHSEIEFLLLKRSREQIYPGLWQMVNGKIKAGEKAYQAAVRELLEETGLSPIQLWVVPNVNSFYSAQSDNLIFIPVFAAKVNSKNQVVISSEHEDFCWVNAEEAKKLLAWEGQRKSADLIVKYFNEDKHFFDLLEIEF